MFEPKAAMSACFGFAVVKSLDGRYAPGLGICGLAVFRGFTAGIV